MKNILITGPQGSGKTTLIIRLSEIFKEFNPSGFYTSEVIQDGSLVGFEINSLYGENKVLSHVNLKSKHSVGKFKIDVKGFEEFLENIFYSEKKKGVYFIDEIGKMECISKKFTKLILELLNSEKTVVATIAEKGPGLIQEIKKREDVRLYELNPEKRDLMIKGLTMEIRDLLLE